MRQRSSRKIYLFFHSLMGRWMLITCLILLPVIVFSILAVRTGSRSYMETMKEQLRNRVDAYAQELIYDEQTIHESISADLIETQSSSLYNGDPLDSIMTDIRLKTIFAGIPMRLPGYTATYIYDKSRDMVTCFNLSAPNALTEAGKREAEAAVRSEKLAAFGPAAGTSTSGKGWVFMNYVYPYFSFGYMINLDVLLHQFYDNSLGFEGRAAWVTANGTETSVWPLEKADANQNESIEILLSAKVPRMGGKLIYSVSSREARLHYPAAMYIFYALAFLSILMIPLLYLLARKLIMNPLRTLADGMQEVEAENLDYRIQKKYGTIEMNFLMNSFNSMAGQIQHMTIASYKHEISKLQTETINAHLQVNQHMLTNSLNVVYSLIQMKRYDEASEFTLLLTKYFQYALRKNSAIVTLREELAFVEDYIRLQKIRLRGRFTSVYQVPEEAKELEIPQLLLQGFLENAFKYAIVPDRMTEILIDAQVRDGRLLLTVVDNGAGMTKERLEALREGKMVEDTAGKHVGLWNVRKRLSYYYGEDYDLQISSDEGQGTMIHVSLPPHPADKERLAILAEKSNQEGGAGQ
ncbi:MAG: histidine kinase [Clostridia bacterium]|nr:histidine kinase [Clostridia bacterium]